VKRVSQPLQVERLVLLCGDPGVVRCLVKPIKGALGS